MYDYEITLHLKYLIVHKISTFMSFVVYFPHTTVGVGTGDVTDLGTFLSNVSRCFDLVCGGWFVLSEIVYWIRGQCCHRKQLLTEIAIGFIDKEKLNLSNAEGKKS